MLNTDKYISVIWEKGGRIYPYLDCFGIVNEIRRDLNLNEWPDFSGITKDDGGLDREAKILMKDLKFCKTPCVGAGIACYSGSIVNHVAIVVEINGLLYAAECNPKKNVTFSLLPIFKRRFIKLEFWK